MKNILLGLGIIIAFSFNPVFAGDPEKAYEYEQKANQYLLNQDYELAAHYFLLSICEYEDNHDLKEFLSRFNINTDNFSSAEIEYVKSIENKLTNELSKAKFVY